ncbi:MAG: GntR family transcriptional regulator [Lachnospiraceae bacterium]|nr:GntR family transcriptional regulator [Lachnospiraceae bacterium]
MIKEVNPPEVQATAQNKTKRPARSLVADEIMDQIMDWIMDGKLQMGDRLNTEQLAKEMGISRMPVREALSSLEQKGLAYSIPYAGMRLVELSDGEVLEIYRIRQLLEPEAAYAACKNATEEDIAGIEKAFYEHVAAISSLPVNPREVHKKNRAFHFSIFQASHMNHLCKAIEELWDKLSFVKMLYGESFLNSESKRTKMIDEHRRYLEYVRNGEAAAIKGAIYMNIDEKLRKYVLKEDNSGTSAE